MNSIRTASETKLITKMINSEKEIKNQIRYSIEQTLWEVGNNADKYEGKREIKNIEDLAKSKLQRKLKLLEFHSAKNNLNSELNLENEDMKIDLIRNSNAFSTARIIFPDNSYLFRKLPDNSLTAKQRIKNLKIPTGMRFHFLREKMDEFEEDMKKVGRRWMFAEYAIAYTQAWLGKEVNLDKKRSEVLFQTAFGSYELEKFGSSDYIGIAKDIFSSSKIGQLLENCNSKAIENPTTSSKIESMKKRINLSIIEIESSTKNIQNAISEIKKFRKFEPNKVSQETIGKLLNIENEFENSSKNYLKRKFKEVCDQFTVQYEYIKKIKSVKGKINSAKKSINKTENHFRDVLIYLKRISENNPFLRQFYDSLTNRKENYSLSCQMQAGLETVRSDLSLILEKIGDIERSIEKSKISNLNFPGNYPTKFNEILKEGDKKHAKKILSSAKRSAAGAGSKLKRVASRTLKKSRQLHNLLENTEKKHTKKPEPNCHIRYNKYPGINKDPNSGIRSVSVEKHVIRREKVP